MSTPVTAMPLRQRQTIGWIDLLRVVAAFLVVFAHSCDAFVGAFDTDRAQFLTGVFCGSLTRPCVPLFVMMTAVLLLPVRSEQTLGTFYRKRIGRIIVPLIFWSITLPIAFWGYFSTIGASSANPMVSVSDYDTANLGVRLYTWIFNFNFDTVPLWYLYMLIGLYLIMPILSAWLDKASQSEVKLFLKVWGITLLLPYIQLAAPLLGYQGNWGNYGILGVCDWNVYGSFYYASGFIGYMVMAYYLTRWPLQWSWSRTCSVFIPMFMAGYAITSSGYVWFQQMFPGNYAYLEIIWLFCGINVVMMTVPVFVIVQKCNARGSLLLTRLASLSFGVYLCHFIFVFMAYDLYNVSWLCAPLRILGGAVTATAGSLVIVWLLSLSRPLRRLIA